MDSFGKRQGALVAPRVPDSQGWLVLTKGPNGVRGLLGNALTDCGTLDVEGDYEAELITEGWAVVFAHVKVSAVTGTIMPVLITRWYDGTTRDTNGATNFVANTNQSLTIADLNGQRRAILTFSIGAGESCLFSRSEFNGQ